MTSEDPWDAWRRRGLPPGFPSGFPAGFPPEFFAEFEKEFARMQGMISKVMEDALKHASGPQRGEPFVYGFSMRVGKDGVPQLTPFGSAAPFSKDVVEGTDAREPLTDVVEGDREIAVTVELPGVDKQDVNLHVGEDAVTVKVDKGRRYAKTIHLPAPVVPSSAKATFKNGILDVTLQRRQERRDPGHRVQIE